MIGNYDRGNRCLDTAPPSVGPGIRIPPVSSPDILVHVPTKSAPDLSNDLLRGCKQAGLTKPFFVMSKQQQKGINNSLTGGRGCNYEPRRQFSTP